MLIDLLALSAGEWLALGIAFGLLLALALRVVESLLAKRPNPVPGATGAFDHWTAGTSAARPEDDNETAVRDALDAALAAGRPFFNIVLQPQVRLADRTLVGVEALIRWDAGPPLGQLPPSLFIPIAERSGAILRLDMRVFETSIERFSRLPPSVRRQLTLSINFSIFHFLDLGFPERILTICRRYDVAPTCVELEITEHSAPEYLEPVRRTMGALRSNGFGIALDDFGTGFTSLRFLQTLPFSKVKLDVSFVSQVDEGLRGRQLVGSLVRLADALDLTMVAEGIERSGQVEQLLRLGCQVGQGYLLAKPVPDHEFYAWAARQLRSQYQPEYLDELQCKLAPGRERGHQGNQRDSEAAEQYQYTDRSNDRQSRIS